MKNLSDLAAALNEFAAREFPDSYFQAASGENICSALHFRFTKEKKEDWKNGIFHNSPTVFIGMISPVGARWEKDMENPLYKFEVSLDYAKSKARAKTGDLAAVFSHVKKILLKLSA